MAKTILITGASSGIGRATALYFADKGWKVIATMRNVARASFGDRPDIRTLRLDVCDPVSIRQAADEATQTEEGIGVLLNNAGYGLRGVLEGYTHEQIEAQLRTNVLGLIDLIRAFLPHFRDRGGGTIINVSSVGGRIGFPLYSVYRASKFAVEGLTEALAYELAPHGIRVRLIEPGFIRTDFHTRSMDRAEDGAIPAYQDFVRRTLAAQARLEDRGLPPEKAARVIFRAATSRGTRLRYPVGLGARLVLLLRAVLPFPLFRAVFRRLVLGRKSS